MLNVTIRTVGVELNAAINYWLNVISDVNQTATVRGRPQNLASAVIFRERFLTVAALLRPTKLS